MKENPLAASGQNDQAQGIVTEGVEDVHGGKVPIGTLVTRLAAARPDAPAVTCGAVTLTRAQLESAANRLARAYQQLGVGQGDMVTIALPNDTEFVVVCCALWKLGAIPQPVSAKLPVAERQAIVEVAGSRLVVGALPGDHGGLTCLPVGFEPADDLDDGPLPEVVSPSWKAPTSGGSTGRPKVIVAGQSGLWDDIYAQFFGTTPDEAQLVAGPLYHNGPFMYAMVGFFAGQHLVVLPRFDAVEALETIERYKVDFAFVVPTMMSRMLRVIEEAERTYDLSSLSRLWHAAAPCPDWLKRAWIDLLGPEKLFELYGGTEAQAITVIDGKDWLERPGSVGRVLLGEMTVLDEEGKELPPGEVGELFMRAPGGKGSTYHYLGAEAKTLGTWESIGDMGSMDADGFVYIADRRTDLILSGGANIYPAEVEAALEEHPSVVSCAVVGVPDEDMGQIVHAVVQLRSGAGSDVETAEAELRQHMHERLVRYKVPRTWELVDSPVRDDAGKVRRSSLAERAASS